MAKKTNNGQGMDLVQKNLVLRKLLRDNSPLMTKALPAANGVLGGNTRIKLFNVGLTTNVFLRVVADITIGTAAATVGPKSAFAMIPRVRLIDFDGSDRINCSAFQLFQRNSMRDRKMDVHGFSGVVSNVGNAAGAAGLTSPLINPKVPTAISNDKLEFFLQIPVAADVDSGDLRGAILSQTNVGELYLSLDWATALYANGDDDKVYNGAATSVVTVNSITVEPMQEYYLPNEVDGILPIPPLDISTVYEIGAYLKTSDNIATGNDKLLSLPNVRSIVGMYASYLNNNVLGGSAGNDMSKFKLIANGNNILYEASTAFQYFFQRKRIGSDLPKGVFVFDYSANPLNTFLYGNLQMAFQPGGVVTAGANLEVCYESFYTKGAAMSGPSQAG